MSPSVPLEIDLEDRLIYGLSPQRFGYLVLGGLAAMSLWAQVWLPGAIRIGLCVLPLGLAAALAWGGWRGRGLDLLLYDAVRYLIRNYRVEVVRQPPVPTAALPTELYSPSPAACTSPGLDPAPWFG